MKKLTEELARIGIVANPEKTSGLGYIRRAAGLVAATGREVAADAETIKAAGLEVRECRDLRQLGAEVDLVLAFGGDGTILRVAREVAESAVPILGVNLGTLGFLTDCTCKRMSQALRHLWDGRCVIESRHLIQASGPGKEPPTSELALNDFVLSRGTLPRLVEIEVSVDGDWLTTYRGDGLVVSSPTGSTAYSLAAGGAVVSPRAHVFAVTPICPHTLSNRSVIVSLKSVIQVKLISRRVEIVLAADGQMQSKVLAGRPVTFRKSRHQARLVRLPGTSFFKTLRQKLNWSGSTV